jgi:hypothetical protein
MRCLIRRIEKLERLQRLAPAERPSLELLMKAVFDLSCAQLEDLVSWCGAAANGRSFTRSEMEARRAFGEAVMRRCQWAHVRAPKILPRRWFEQLAIEAATWSAMPKDLVEGISGDIEPPAATARWEKELERLLTIWRHGNTPEDKGPHKPDGDLREQASASVETQFPTQAISDLAAEPEDKIHAEVTSTEEDADTP